MAHLFRLIVGLLLCLSGPAFALVPLVTNNGFKVSSADNGSPPDTTIYATRQALCDAQIASFGETIAKQVLNESGQLDANGDRCRLARPDWQQYNFFFIVVATETACPANSSPSGSACACISPYAENGAQTACVAPPDPCADLAGKDAGDKSWNGGPVTGDPLRLSFTFCDGWNPAGDGKCVVTAQRDASFGVDGQWINQGRGKYTGAKATSCSGDGGSGSAPADAPKPPGTEQPPVTPNPGEAAPAPCPQGQLPGTVNGTRVCAAAGPETPVQGNDSKEIKNPDGSSSRIDGSTKCVDGKCTTDSRTCTKTAPEATESCTGTTSSTQSQGTYCNANKGSSVCQGEGGTGSSFGGDCAAGFKATGDDAVLNAMALEQYKRNCKFFDSVPADTPESTAYADMKGKFGTDQTGDMPADSKRTVTISGADFDSSSLIGSSMCVQDLAIVVAGMSVTLPISKVCPFLDYLGTIMLVIAWIVAARIVFWR